MALPPVPGRDQFPRQFLRTLAGFLALTLLPFALVLAPLPTASAAVGDYADLSVESGISRPAISTPVTTFVHVYNRPNYSDTATVQLWGPYQDPALAKCTPGAGAVGPVGTVSVPINGNASYTSPSITLPRMGGYYYWKVVLPAADGYPEITNDCLLPSARMRVLDLDAPHVRTRASAQRVESGTAIYDTVSVPNRPLGTTMYGTSYLYGPFDELPTQDCALSPAGAFAIRDYSFVNSEPAMHTPSVTVTEPGWYTWVQWLRDSNQNSYYSIQCLQEESTYVAPAPPTPKQPQYSTQASRSLVAFGQPVHDDVTMTGLDFGGQEVPDFDVTWELYGPFPERELISCAVKPFRTGTMTVAAANSEFSTPDVVITRGGWYTYVLSNDDAEMIIDNRTECGETTETFQAGFVCIYIDPCGPGFTVETTISDTEIGVGESVHDVVKVSDSLGRIRGEAKGRLYGPYNSLEEAGCYDELYATVTYMVNGDGTYTTPSVTIDEPGIYTWVQELPDSKYAGYYVHTECGLPEESTTVTDRTIDPVDGPKPSIRTQASHSHAQVGIKVTDKIWVSGIDSDDTVTVNWSLLGPVKPVRGGCSTVKWKQAPTRARGTFVMTGPGSHRTRPIRLGRAGCFTYTVKIPATTSTTEATHRPGHPAETVRVFGRAVSPAIGTGGSGWLS